MDDFLIVAIMIAAAAAILVFARRSSEVSPNPQNPSEIFAESDAPPRRTVVGSEIPFPFDIREFEQRYGPDVKRPKLLNYYFKNTKLDAGPPNAESFLDEFFVQFENEDNQYRWTAEYIVATPRGIEEHLRANRYESMSGDGMIIVPRYDLATILRAVLEQQMDVPESEGLTSTPLDRAI